MSRLSIVTIALAAISLLWASAIDQRNERAMCERIHSASTCQHILR